LIGVAEAFIPDDVTPPTKEAAEKSQVRVAAHNLVVLIKM
jgi:hypothetical protein